MVIVSTKGNNMCEVSSVFGMCYVLPVLAAVHAVIIISISALKNCSSEHVFQMLSFQYLQ